ncbi:MAG: hypothetical protein K6F49_04280 [Saccharofermentans sp.]|nr:hypothetical protein [Saccharofermentans sp.]
MDCNSILHGTLISEQCDRLLAELHHENELLTGKIEAVRLFIDSNLTGRAFTAMKRYSAEFIRATLLMIEANDRDIEDIVILRNIAGNYNIIGNDVLTNLDCSQRQYYRNRDIANDYTQRSSLATNPIEKIHYNRLAQSQNEIANSWESIYQSWQREESLYDQLNSETFNLFSGGREIRYQAGQLISRLSSVRIADINATHLSQLVSNTLNQISNQISDISIIPDQATLDEIAARHGFTEDEMEYLCEFHPGLVNQLYRMDILGVGRSELVLRIIRGYLDDYHDNAYVCNGYIVPEEYILMLAELENNSSTLSFCGYYEGDVLVGIYPHYVCGDSGITFGYGHYVSDIEYNGDEDHDPDPSEVELVDQYVPSPSFFQHDESSRVPGSSYVPIEECNRLLGQDFSIHFEVVVDWLESNDIQLSMSQIIALTIYRFREGNILPLQPYIIDYYNTGTYDADTWNYLWLGQNPEDNPAPQNRIDTYNNLFFGT